MKINEVEAQVGITKKNIRFYEEQGLLHPGRNSENGYREYGEAEVAVLKQIKLLRKLGLPLEEIRQMQAGERTVGDAMRRHLVTLERDRSNLESAARLCEALKDRDEWLCDLDTDAIFAEMAAMEQAGTTFQNKQDQDVRIQYVAPVITAAAVVLFMAGMIALMVWAICIDPESTPPLPVILVLVLIPVVVILGVFLALGQRLKEIRKGEMDDAKKY